MQSSHGRTSGLQYPRRKKVEALTFSFPLTQLSCAVQTPSCLLYLPGLPQALPYQLAKKSPPQPTLHLTEKQKVSPEAWIEWVFLNNALQPGQVPIASAQSPSDHTSPCHENFIAAVLMGISVQCCTVRMGSIGADACRWVFHAANRGFMYVTCFALSFATQARGCLTLLLEVSWHERKTAVTPLGLEKSFTTYKFFPTLISFYVSFTSTCNIQIKNTLKLNNI